MRGGRRAHGAVTHASATTAYELLADDGDRQVSAPETDLPEDLLADLYHHPLIITPDYVGRDRRTRSVRHHPERRRASGRRDSGDPGDARASGPVPSLRWIEVLVIVVSTILVAVPLTLMGSHAPAAGTSNHSPTPDAATSTPGAGALAVQRPAGSTPSRQARAATRARSARQSSARRAAALRRREASALHARRASSQRAARRAAVARRQALAKQERTRTRSRARSRAQARARAAARARSRSRRPTGRA